MTKPLKKFEVIVQRVSYSKYVTFTVEAVTDRKAAMVACGSLAPDHVFSESDAEYDVLSIKEVE